MGDEKRCDSGKRNLSLIHISFAYDNTDHPAVSHLTFMAKAGAITALVGHSGSGKSTAASLIPRFYDVQDGAVKIGGVDIREIPQGDLMKMVAFVFQDPKLLALIHIYWLLMKRLQQ